MPKERDKRIVDALLAAVGRILEPLVEILLRYGVSVGALETVLRRTYLEVAERDYAIPGRKLSASRVAVLTGLSRRDVAALRKLADKEQSQRPEHVNRAARVIAAWRREPDFQSKTGTPLTLPFDGEEPSFSSLVRAFAGDVPARATLDELLRVGAAERLKDGRIRLVSRAYVPKGADADIIRVLGNHVPDLIGSIDHNLTCEPDERFFQRRVVYRNLPADRGALLRPVIAGDAQELLEKLDAQISAHDRTVNPEVEGDGKLRVVLGIYYLEEDLS